VISHALDAGALADVRAERRERQRLHVEEEKRVTDWIGVRS
jgi:hypothetical protein